MKLYNSIGPNPRMVRMFMHEKGIEVPIEEVDLMGGENRREPYVSEVNPSGQLPALALDSGEVITEITAICEYLEDIQPEPHLIGATPEERAETRMWTRRIDLNIIEPLANGFRFSEGAPIFKGRIHMIPQAADDLKAIAQEKLAWLDGLLAGKSFIAGERFTMADVLLFSFLDFGKAVGQPVNPGLANVMALLARIGERESAKATA
jgi:glutathione S-transferase